MTYFEDTLGRPPGRADDPLRDGVKMGTTLVGSPETVVKGIKRLQEYSQGGFGGILFRAHEWANREQTLRSYDAIPGPTAWGRILEFCISGAPVRCGREPHEQHSRDTHRPKGSS
jgi:hypothetical protein